MEFWYPKRTRHPFKKKPSRIKFGRFWSQRLYNQKQLERQNRIIYFYHTLNFATRVGALILCFYTYFINIEFDLVSWQVDLPRAKSGEEQKIMRDIIYVAVNKDGEINIHNRVVKSNDLFDIFDQARMDVEHPLRVTSLHIDKNCKMSVVYDIYTALREAGAPYVNHAVRQISTPVTNSPYQPYAYATWFSITLTSIFILTAVFYMKSRETRLK